MIDKGRVRVIVSVTRNQTGNSNERIMHTGKVLKTTEID